MMKATVSQMEEAVHRYGVGLQSFDDWARRDQGQLWPPIGLPTCFELAFGRVTQDVLIRLERYFPTAPGCCVQLMQIHSRLSTQFLAGVDLIKNAPTPSTAALYHAAADELHRAAGTKGQEPQPLRLSLAALIQDRR